MPIDELANLLIRRDVQMASTDLFTGEVTDSSVSPPLIQVGASDTAVPCPCLSSYSPADGDFVVVLTAGATRVCLGAVAAKGWQRIGDGQESAVSSFTVTVPASTYELVRVHIFGQLAAGVQVMRCRVNNDSTAIYRYVIGRILGDNTSDGLTQTGQTSWRVGGISATANTNFEFTIWPIGTTGSYSAPTSMQCVSSLYNATDANASVEIAGGNLSSSLTLSSLVFFPDASTFTGRWIAEGYVP